MLKDFFNSIYSSLSFVPFDTLMWIVWGSFAAIFLLVFIMCFISSKIRAASKRPYLCLVNAYAAVTLAAGMTTNELPQSVLAAAIFWCIGYVSFGLLCFISKPAKPRPAEQIAVSSLPVVPPKPAAEIRTEVPAAKNSVRLEHAISVTDKLLSKNLGKSDRQELEKLKNTLAVLQMKGNLSPTESDILNENFNALLKLMAKYNV